MPRKFATFCYALYRHTKLEPAICLWSILSYFRDLRGEICDSGMLGTVETIVRLKDGASPDWALLKVQ